MFFTPMRETRHCGLLDACLHYRVVANEYHYCCSSKDYWYHPPTTNYFLVVMLDEGILGTTISGKIKHKTNITEYSWKSFQLRSSSTVMRSGNNTSSVVRLHRGTILKKTGSKCNWVVNKRSDKLGTIT